MRKLQRMAAAILLAMFAAMDAPAMEQADNAAIYTITGIKVDVTDKSATQAKLKAFGEAQMKAFRKLVARLGRAQDVARLRGLKPSQVGRMLAAITVEEERTGPRRYIGKLTVRFVPDKVREALAAAGVAYNETPAPRMLIIPVWKTDKGPVVWEDNPWRRAWLDLKAENSLVPIIIPLGDLTDANALSAPDAVKGDAAKLEALRLRYGTDTVLVTIAEPRSDNSVRARMIGDSPIGKILFDKTYMVSEGGIEAAAQQAAQRFHTVMVFKWKERVAAYGIGSTPVQAVQIAVPFSTLDQWNGIRAQLEATPGVTGVDVTTLTPGSGGVVRLSYNVAFQQLQSALGERRLTLTLVGGTWVLQGL